MLSDVGINEPSPKPRMPVTGKAWIFTPPNSILFHYPNRGKLYHNCFTKTSILNVNFSNYHISTHKKTSVQK